MTPQACVAVSFVRRLVIRAGVARGNSVMSAALQALVLGVTLIYPGAQDPVHTYCNTGAIEEPRELRPLEEGITLAPQSRVSVRKTAKALFIRILKGEVLFKRRVTRDYPVVVTAGNAQITRIEAVVCVGVEKERTVIAVLDGAIEMWALGPDRTRYAMHEITLRAGDRVELRQIGSDVVLHFATNVSVGRGSCASAIRREAREARVGDSARFRSR
jgi:ferric-dicitrate binding protein FerR (iron transport regulator)